MADRTARILIGVDAETAAAEKGIADVGTAVGNLDQKLDAVTDGSAAKRLGDLPEPLRQAFIRAELAAQNLNTKIEQGSISGPRDLRKITIAQTLLNLEIEKSGKTLDKLGPDATATYAKLEGAQKKALAVTRQLNQDLDDATTEARLGTAGFSGFGNALEQMGGQAGKAAEALGFVGGAFAAGMAAGSAFNNFIKTDMQAQETFMSLLAMRMRTAIEGIADAFVAANQAMAAIATGDWKRLKELNGELETSFDKVTGAITKTDAELYAERDALKIAEDAAAKLAEENKRLEEAQKKAADEAKKFADAQRKIAEETRKLNESLKEQQALMQQAEIDASVNKAQGDENADQLRNTAGSIERVSGNLDKLHGTLEQQISDFGETSAAVQNTTREIAEQEKALEVLRDRYERLSESLDKHRESEDEASAAMARAQEETKALEKQKEDLRRETDALNGTAQDSILLQDHTTVALGEAGKAHAAYRNETVLVKDAKTGEQKITQQLVLETTANTEATKRQTDEQKKASTVVNETTAELGKLAAVSLAPIKDQVTTLKAELDALAAVARQAHKDMVALSKAGEDDSGSDDGISIRRSGSSTELGAGDKLGGGFKGSKP